MNDSPIEGFETDLRRITPLFDYPPTPDIAGAVAQRLAGRTLRPLPIRRIALGVTLALLILLAGLMSVPPVRAAVLDFLRIGAVRIFLQEPTPTPTPAFLTDTPSPAASATTTPVTLNSLLDLDGKIPLEDAQRKAGFPLRLPAYPADLGLPDHVFLQDLGGTVVVLVWMAEDASSPDRAEGDHVKLSLFAIGPGSWAVEKGKPDSVQLTAVNGEQALWASGPYPLRLRSGDLDFRYIVPGNALIWAEGNVTYRLEGSSDMQEAVRIAESLALLP